VKCTKDSSNYLAIYKNIKTGERRIDYHSYVSYGISGGDRRPNEVLEKVVSLQDNIEILLGFNEAIAPKGYRPHITKNSNSVVHTDATIKGGTFVGTVEEALEKPKKQRAKSKAEEVVQNLLELGEGE
jgi:hypothetical protein